MKILVVSDVESKSLWDYYSPSKVEGVEMILSCGDLAPEYLSFLVTMVNKPLFYVHGNHDDIYEKRPPEGCISVDNQVYVYRGIRILGLGGSYDYNGGLYQYSDRQMRWRVRFLWRQLLVNRGVDILLTHAPAAGVNDGEDLPHKGFEVFTELLDRYCPKYFIHGHVHMNYGRRYPRICQYKDTVVINGYESYIFEYDV